MLIAENQEWNQSGDFPLKEKAIIGVVHLKALPGSPGFDGHGAKIWKAAMADAAVLCEGGVDGLIVENYGDAPFFPEKVEPHTVALMGVIVRDIASRCDVPVGVNVLRNDGLAALGVAMAGGGAFVRVNVFTGAAVTDQGVIQGKAHELLRYRQSLNMNTAILADVHVKHSQPLGGGSLVDAGKDALLRGRADALVLTGSATGQETSLADLQALRQALPEAILLAGSGVTPESVKGILEKADGAIVGTWLKKGGKTEAPVDRDRVATFMKAAREE